MRHGTAALTAACLLVATVDPARAGSFGIAPLRVDFDESHKSDVVQIRNTSDQELSLQVEAMTWRQAEDGEDRYENTEQLVAVPPIFTLPPGETQLVRVGTVASPALDHERAYRLYLTEILPAKHSGGTRLRLRVGIPVFVAPILPASPGLEFVSTDRLDDRLRVTLNNPGNSHVRVKQLTIVPETENAPEQSNAAQYVLAGAQRSFFLEIPVDYAVGRIIAATDSLGVREFVVRPQ